jgi:hypothetical protein
MPASASFYATTVFDTLIIALTDPVTYLKTMVISSCIFSLKLLFVCSLANLLAAIFICRFLFSL